MSVDIEIAPPLAWVRVNNPPVNALSHSVRQGLVEALETLEADDHVKAVILICQGRTFFAGADIREFGKPLQSPGLPSVIDQIESAKKPWIAAIHGTVLGGGLETALGCHYRIAVGSAKFGFPEVNLGLIPGAGGTVRLPRVTGIALAVEMVTTGKPVSATKALETGLLDAIAPDDDLAEFAMEFARSILDRPKPVVIIERDIPGEISPDYWETSHAIITKKARGQQSPIEAFEAIRDAANLPASQAFIRERQRFEVLHDSDQSKALRHVFFAERQCSKISQLGGLSPTGLAHTAVIGGGTMGSGIAAAMLLSGLKVTMIERDAQAIEAGKNRTLEILNASHKRGLVDDDQLQALQDAFTASTDYEKLRDADMVVEAVFEDMEIKKQVFKILQKCTPAYAILASNTSYLDVNQLAGMVENPSRVLGMHFFSPAHIMKLVEIIQTDTVSNETLATGFSFAKRLGKTPVLAGICEGFIGNRILSSYRKQCDYMLEDGASPQEIDAAMIAFGMPMGIFAMQDMAGLDIGWATRKRLAPARDKNERYVKIADRLCELGRFGQKTGVGWYAYPDGSRAGTPDPVVEKIIAEERAAKNITPRNFNASEIQDRILESMISEGKTILKEGIARTAADIDVVMVLGYAFPRWRGGPMFAAGIVD